jgi:hypothetical protein
VDYLSAVSLEDVDGDGDLDLAAGAWWDTAWIHLNQDGLQDVVGWQSEHTDIVVEGFAWEDLDGSHWREVTVTGDRLLAIPGRGRVLSVQGGVAGRGYVTGPGTFTVTYLQARARDLAVSDWEPEGPNHVYIRP